MILAGSWGATALLGAFPWPKAVNANVEVASTTFLIAVLIVSSLIVESWSAIRQSKLFQQI